MAKPKAPLEIRKAKIALEEKITGFLYDAITLWQRENPEWMVTAADLFVIDVTSHVGGQARCPATSVVEITKKDLTMKIMKSGAVKEMKT